jgi:ribulose-phosphate 3-epimerase
MLDDRELSAELEVDGGISSANARDVVEAGGRVLVVGASVFKAEERPGRALQTIRRVVS